LFRSITGVPDNIQGTSSHSPSSRSPIASDPDRCKVIPAINSNFAHHIAAGLEDGTVITGQNQISHPSPPASGIPQVFFPPITPVTPSDSEAEEEEVEDANLPGSLAELRKQNIAFSKHDEAELTSRIERVWYINPYGQEIRPPANPKAISSLNHAEAVIYSIGSLYTRYVVPSLFTSATNKIPVWPPSWFSRTLHKPSRDAPLTPPRFSS
jgi:hypothetical protein